MLPDMESRADREEKAKAEAKSSGRNVVYIDDDGCEVTVTPSGHVFFNVDDWY